MAPVQKSGIFCYMSFTPFKGGSRHLKVFHACFTHVSRCFTLPPPTGKKQDFFHTMLALLPSCWPKKVLCVSGLHRWPIWLVRCNKRRKAVSKHCPTTKYCNKYGMVLLQWRLFDLPIHWCVGQSIFLLTLLNLTLTKRR